jgi:hypothetical protein
MPKYSNFKYGEGKYGRYQIEIQGEISLGDLTKYRMKTIDSAGIESRPITNTKATIPGTGGPVKVRLKTNDGNWVTQQNAAIEGDPPRVRIRSVSKDGESRWIQSSKGIIRKKG